MHEYPPTFERILSYPRYNPHPYRIIIIDPRPAIESDLFFMHEFNVDEPIPEMVIPLNGDDFLKFDFNLPYQHTFAASFYGDKVDYTRLPVNFDAYSDSDKACTLTRMLAVIAAAQRNDDLEQAPQALEILPLEEALKQYQNFREKIE